MWIYPLRWEWSGPPGKMDVSLVRYGINDLENIFLQNSHHVQIRPFLSSEGRFEHLFIFGVGQGVVRSILRNQVRSYNRKWLKLFDPRSIQDPYNNVGAIPYLLS
jgi:hypothetical protein